MREGNWCWSNIFYLLGGPQHPSIAVIIWSDIACYSLFLYFNSFFVEIKLILSVLTLQASPFRVAWLYESGAPIFGSLSLDSLTGNGKLILLHLFRSAGGGGGTSVNYPSTISYFLIPSVSYYYYYDKIMWLRLTLQSFAALWMGVWSHWTQKGPWSGRYFPLFRWSAWTFFFLEFGAWYQGLWRYITRFR